jgi:hypothetical protein
MKSLGFPAEELVHFYRSSILSVLEYASPLWSPGLTTEQVRQIETIQCRALQIIKCTKLKIGSAFYQQCLDIMVCNC